ncbi:PaaI family thioesterase [Aureivirga marina]|uniref:PaaI family thioesterase n=1 Tax=Aureivirga marina TaxID=1182451 RepID=UPI0018CB95F8|nr:hotdog fold thioesterase [Aureivirga marina]
MNKKEILEKLNELTPKTLMETLEITYTDVGEDFVEASMPVNSRVHQPLGLLHGGAIVALAESVGSAASYIFVNPKESDVRGVEIAANHVKSKREGTVRAIAKIIHRGRTTHLWQIRVVDEEENLISLCKLTNIVLPRKK